MEETLNRAARVTCWTCLLVIFGRGMAEAQQAQQFDGGRQFEGKQIRFAGAKPSRESREEAAQKTDTEKKQRSGIDSSKEADIHRLMTLTNFIALVKQTMTGMEANIRTLMTNALPPGEYRSKLVDLFIVKFQANLRMNDLADRAVPVYDRHYSSSEIRELIRFYETPIGQKLLKELPAVSAELQQAGSAWGEEVGKETMTGVLAEHPDLAKALEDASKQAKP